MLPSIEGAKGDKKRHTRHPQGAMTTTDHDDGEHEKAGGSSMQRVTTATCDDKR
jgi:hypothetical protein